jgi:hypothetical protein
MAKRIICKLRIKEISSVDRPAQEGAVALILKRRGQGIMDGIVNDTPSADEAILESVRSIVDDYEMDDGARVAMLLESIRQYTVATGATLDNPNLGGPAELGATIIAVSKAVAEIRSANPSLTEVKARALLFEHPAHRELVKRYNEEMAAAADEAEAIAKAAGRAKKRPESDEAKRNRLKQERAARHGALSKTAA